MKQATNLAKSKVLWIVVSCIALILIWFRDDMFFAGGEGGIPFYNLDKTFDLSAFSWRNAQGGIPNIESVIQIPYLYTLKTLEFVGVQANHLQAITFLFLLVVPGLSVYFLLKETLNIENKIAFVGATFYLLNPYSMMQVWGRGLYSQLFPFALFPAILLLVTITLKKRNLVYSTTALLFSFLLSSAFTNLSYLLSFWFMLGVYGLYFFLTNKSLDDRVYLLKTYLFIFFGFLLVHYWWLNYTFYSLPSLVENRSSSLEHNLGTLRGVSWSVPFIDIIRLLHNFLTKDRNYGDIYFNPIFVLISLFYPIAFLYSLKAFKKLKHYKFYMPLFLLSFFIVLGANAPLGFLFEFLFIRIQFLQAFRNPYEKMGIIFLITYIPFIAVGAKEMAEKLSQKFSGFWKTDRVLSAMLLIVCGFYVWPMWTGHFAGGFKFDPWISVPKYYEQANDWISSMEGDFRIFHLPINPGDGLRYDWVSPYQGTDPADFLFNRPSISKNVVFNKPYYNVLLERFGVLQEDSYGVDPDISKSEFSSDSFVEELAKLNVRYVVLHYDYNPDVGSFQSLEDVEEYLSSTDGLARVKQFEKLAIYEIASYLPHIYSSDGEVEYKYINPARYEVKVNSIGPLEIHFLENYNSGWKARVNGVENGEHFKVFSYANGWRFEKLDGEIITLTFEPQESLDYGFKISLVSVIILIVSSFLLIVKKQSV